MVRPHPGLWRLVHGVIVVYLLALVFLLFQNVDDARQLFRVRPLPALLAGFPSFFFKGILLEGKSFV